MKNRLVEIAISDIAVKFRLRKDNGDLKTLQNSIRTIGLLHPVIIDKHHTLISGGRRLEACRNLGMKTIYAIKLDTTCDSITAISVQADENLCRIPLTHEELDDQIRMKKSIISNQTASGIPRVWARLKNLFSQA